MSANVPQQVRNLCDVLRSVGARVEIQCGDGVSREGELVVLLLLYHHYGRLRLPLSGEDVLVLPDVTIKNLDFMIKTITSELVESLFNEDIYFDNINKESRLDSDIHIKNQSFYQDENDENLKKIQKDSKPHCINITEANIVYPGMRFSCKICSRTYSNQRNLASHMHSHTSPHKRFQCNQCPKNFSANCTLKSHVETEHDGVRLAECEYCEQKFKTRYNFKVHKCDVSLEPLECSNCDFMTFRKRSYKSHVRICTLKYSCYKCNYETQLESKFIKHCEKEH